MHKAHNNIINICYDPIFITRINKSNKVSLVSGGGSGHEPLHGGFVGYGMVCWMLPVLELYLLLPLLIRWKRLQRLLIAVMV
ncbi:dihydroxyacetone kinase subunit DhaK [uncultured Brachyspira sp.]|uniref:dihydroxyacetone kinase subunit DhaK n=1 Tax=uncultured Brachyspira sp. TaxID=221953 RepID=UPI0026156BD3|nr:dihydroxyacetone kinase subunit DhaK [uncultured Brachyspira sp.]